MNDNTTRRATKVRSGIIPKVKSAAVSSAHNVVGSLQNELDSLQLEVVQLRESSKEANHTLKLPQGEVSLTLKLMSQKQCHVWQGNSRRFKALTPDKVADILESIREIGVQEPLYGRPTEQGIEIIDGSRRLFACGLISGEMTLPIWVGDFTDAQARLMTIVSNNGERLSPYEMGMFAIQEEQGDVFSSAEHIWTHLGIKKTHYYRCKRTASLPQVVVDVFNDPNDMPAKAADLLEPDFSAYIKTYGMNSLKRRLSEVSIDASSKTGEEIIFEIKKMISAPVEKKPTQPLKTVTHSDKKGNKVLKTTQTAKNTLKIEVLVDSPDLQEKIKQMALKLLGVP